MMKFFQRIFRQSNKSRPARTDWNETYEQDLANFAAQLRAQRAENAARKPAHASRWIA